MKNLDASPWFADPRLVVIKTGETGPRRKATFQLQVKRLTKPKESRPSDEPAEAVADEGVVE